MIDNRNLILAIVLSLSILLGFEFLVNAPQRERLAEQQRQEQALTESGQGGPPQVQTGDAPALPGEITAGAGDLPGGLDREQALAKGPRVLVESPTLTGSVALKGARIDDLTLKKYRETIEHDSPNIVLLSPAATDQAYFAGFGWSSANRDVALPGPDTLWQADRGELLPGQPVTLSWTNPQGLRFEQVLELDERYMFTVTQRVVNDGEIGDRKTRRVSRPGRHLVPRKLRERENLSAQRQPIAPGNRLDHSNAFAHRRRAKRLHVRNHRFIYRRANIVDLPRR